MNQNDGFVLFFILAFHIFLKKENKKTKKKTSVNVVRILAVFTSFRDLEMKKLIDMLELRASQQ